MNKLLSPFAAFMVAGISLFSFASRSVAGPASVVVGDPSNPGGLQAAIDLAHIAGATTIKIAPGSYHIPPGAHGGLYFQNYTNTTIDAAEADFGFAPVGQSGIECESCSNLKILGGKYHYYLPQTGQGKVLSVGQDINGVYYDVQLDAGYKQDAAFTSCAIKVGDTVHIRPGTWDFGAKKIVPGNETGSERISVDNGVPKDNRWGVQPGDYIVCRGPGGMMFHLSKCTDCTIQNVTVYWAGCFAFLEDYCSADRYYGDRLICGPPPPGATNVPLLSETADSFHADSDRIGPDIENTTLGCSLDDGIAIHGRFCQVVAQEGNVLTLGASGDHLPFLPGDPIRLANNQSGLIVDAKVIKVSPSSFTTTQASQFGGFKKIRGYYDVTIDQTVNAPFDSLASDPAASGSGFKLINDTILDNRARGLLIKANDGLIEDCVIDGSTIAGIVISPETYWGEAGYSSNITVIGNTIRDTNYAMTGPGYPQAGALTITGEGSMGQRNIKVLNNKFEDLNAANIEVRWADGIEVRGNRFYSPHLIVNPAGDIGKDNGCDGNSVIWVGNSKNVILSDNIVYHLGPAAGTPLVIDPTATDIIGGADGLTIKSKTPSVSAN